MLLFFLLVFFYFFLLSPPTMAYLDPGTGSMILQMIIGGVLAVGYTIKVYWKRIKGFFRKN